VLFNGAAVLFNGECARRVSTIVPAITDDAAAPYSTRLK
jgi:hypothetical protein